jgi:hypothetical protein
VARAISTTQAPLQPSATSVAIETERRDPAPAVASSRPAPPSGVESLPTNSASAASQPHASAAAIAHTPYRPTRVVTSS